MEIQDRQANYPLFFESMDYILKKFPFYKKTADYILNTFEDDYYLFSEKMCGLLLSKAGSRENYLHTLDSFIKVSGDYLKLQAQLRKSGHYLYKNFSEVNNAVYQNNFMESNYLDSLFVSQVFWPNHFKLIRYFKTFCDELDEYSEGMEVPCGAGVFSFVLLDLKKIRSLDLFDISLYSVEYTKKILHLCGTKAPGINIKEASLFDLKEENKYDFIICGELLEHLEDPQKALEVLYYSLKPNGLLFMTTAIYAAALDHIYLFENVKEVRELITRVGFSVSSEAILPLSLKEFSDAMTKEAINYGCVLKK